MLDDIYTSRFFVVADKQSDKIGKHPISNEWWSRKYEYPWCANFVEKTDVCLDSACGVVHPFKYFLADNCKEAHACDIDEDITRVSYNNLIVKKSDILNLKEYEDSYFDKVYNISTLEHLEGKWKDAELFIQSVQRVLKPNGYFILTFDCQEFNWVDIVLNLLSKYFQFVGEVDKKAYSDILVSPQKNAVVFRSIVKKTG
jgi:ubiquinone/menaquinone biosynthesis C-methylase UbiE